MREEGRSGPVSRVLSRATISLGRRLPAASSNLPGSGGGPDRPAPGNSRLLPVWFCSQWGLPCRCGHPHRGALLPHHFTLTAATPPVLRRDGIDCGGIFSVALSRSSRTVGVTHHCVLWSPDFPLQENQTGMNRPDPLAAAAQFAPAGIDCTAAQAFESRAVNRAGPD